MDNWPIGVDDTADALGISDAYMWTKIDATPNFWLDIEPYEYATRLVKELKRKHDVCICSSPSQRKCIDGKQELLLKHKFGFGRQIMFTPQKQFLAYVPNSVLIDDLEKNKTKFEANGGRVILFPQPWNANYRRCNQGKVEYVIRELEGLK